jgi:hypothetical protein
MLHVLCILGCLHPSCFSPPDSPGLLGSIPLIAVCISRVHSHLGQVVHMTTQGHNVSGLAAFEVQAGVRAAGDDVLEDRLQVGRLLVDRLLVDRPLANKLLLDRLLSEELLLRLSELLGSKRLLLLSKTAVEQTRLVERAAGEQTTVAADRTAEERTAEDQTAEERTAEKRTAEKRTVEQRTAV